MATFNAKKIKDNYEKLGKAGKQLGLGEPPPSGLVPVNDWGLYASPDEPVDPRDCERYPDSPWCGGNPLNKKPFDLKIETTVQVNPCGITRSATISGTLVHVKTPKFSIAHIPENCREEYENQGKQKPPDPPLTQKEGYKPTPQYRPYGIDLNAIVCCITVDHRFEEVQEYNWVAQEWRIAVTQIHGAVDEMEYPSDDLVEWWNGVGKAERYTTALASVRGTATSYSSLNKRWMSDYWGINEESITQDQVFIDLRMPPDYPKSDAGNFQGKTYFPTGRPGLNCIALYIGRLGSIFPNNQISPVIDSDYTSPDGRYRSKVIHERFITYCKVISGDTSGRRPPPLEEPPKHCCEDTMGCCQPPYGNRQQQDNSQILQLLRKIDRKIGDSLQVTVFDANEDKKGAQTKIEKPASLFQGIKLAIERNEKLAKILGIDLLPITVPKSVIEKKGEGIFSQIFAFLDFNKNEEINSILEMQTWMFQQLSGILGHWMMEIEVETDFDPTKEGNQRKDGSDAKKGEKEKVILPNMAMTMREQVVMQIQTLKSLGLLVDMQIKSLIDLAGTKVLSAECAARLEDLQLYHDYETEEVTEDLPVQIRMPELDAPREEIENLANFLKEGTIKVSYDRWTVKKSQSLEEKLIQLLEMSSAIRALYFHNGA